MSVPLWSTSDMSTPVDDRELDQLRALGASLEDLRKTTRRVEALRDNLLRDMRTRGVSAIALAQAAELVRSRVYQILEAPPENADDYDMALFAERFDAALDMAVTEWLERGQVGSPEDFFPLEQLVRQA